MSAQADYERFIQTPDGAVDVDEPDVPTTVNRLLKALEVYGADRKTQELAVIGWLRDNQPCRALVISLMLWK